MHSATALVLILLLLSVPACAPIGARRSMGAAPPSSGQLPASAQAGPAAAATSGAGPGTAMSRPPAGAAPPGQSAPPLSAPPSSAMDQGPVASWDAGEGGSLFAELAHWSQRAGWQLVWQAERDYPIEAGARFTGTFVQAAASLVRAFARATPYPIATFHSNRALVITTPEIEE